MRKPSVSEVVLSLVVICSVALLVRAQAGDTSKVEKVATLTSTAEALAEMPDRSILVTDIIAFMVIFYARRYF